MGLWADPWDRPLAAGTKTGPGRAFARAGPGGGRAVRAAPGDQALLAMCSAAHLVGFGLVPDVGSSSVPCQAQFGATYEEVKAERFVEDALRAARRAHGTAASGPQDALGGGLEAVERARKGDGSRLICQLHKHPITAYLHTEATSFPNVSTQYINPLRTQYGQCKLQMLPIWLQATPICAILGAKASQDQTHAAVTPLEQHFRG